MGLFARGALRFSTLLLATTVGLGAASAQTKAPLYAGKQIRMVIASGSGGGDDVYARSGRALADHIPGHPTIVNENMPGGGGLIGINWAYNVAPRDGTRDPVELQRRSLHSAVRR